MNWPKSTPAVRRIAEGGHEVALHGWQHRDIGELGKKRFVRQTARGKALPEDITGGPIHGYRAPLTLALVIQVNRRGSFPGIAVL